jgi:uncharacterized protein
MILQKKRILIFLNLLVCLFITQIGLHNLIPEKPSLATSVYDYANVLSSTEKLQLEEKNPLF